MGLGLTVIPFTAISFTKSRPDANKRRSVIDLTSSIKYTLNISFNRGVFGVLTFDRRGKLLDEMNYFGKVEIILDSEKFGPARYEILDYNL